MPSKRHLSASLPAQCADSSTTRMYKDSVIKSNICQICGDKANIFNYGALACQSCKMFFRRNSVHPECVRPCTNDRSCEINVYNRRTCSACRLTKCFAMGMNTYLIRKEIQSRKTNVSRIQSESNRIAICKQEKFIVRFSGSNSSRIDRPSLDNVEWTLLSNIVHAYDTCTNASPINCYVKQLCISSSSTSDTSLKIANVREIVTFVYKSIQSFIRASPDFRILTAGEQISLSERNLPGVAALYSTVLFRATDMTYSSQCIDAFALVYGSDMMLQSVRVDQRLDPDLTIVKLTLLILAFSSNCFLVHKIENFQNNSFLHGTYRLLGSQTVYVELLWKYMTCRYGYDDSIHRFSRLIEVVLDLIKYSSYIYANNSTHQDLVESVLEQMKRSILIQHNEQEPLWGKT